MKRVATAALLILSILCSGGNAFGGEPEPLHRFSDDRLPPPSARINLLLTGTAAFALSYGPALGASYLWPDAPGASALRIPVAGPWMKIGQTRLCDTDRDPSTCQDALRVIGAIVAGVDGLAQAGSLLFFVEAIFMSTAKGSESGLSNSSYAGLTSTIPGRYRPSTTLPSMRRPVGTLFDDGNFRLRATPYSDGVVDLGIGLGGTF